MAGDYTAADDAQRLSTVARSAKVDATCNVRPHSQRQFLHPQRQFLHSLRQFLHSLRQFLHPQR